jgi:hypothetical protein
VNGTDFVLIESSKAREDSAVIRIASFAMAAIVAFIIVISVAVVAVVSFFSISSFENNFARLSRSF